MNKVIVGVIGAGRIGRLHVDNLQKLPSLEVKAVSEAYLNEELKLWAESQGIGLLTTDTEIILQDPEIMAVFICTPTDTHAELIIRAARAGKHIFCEKPVSLSLEKTMEALRVVGEEGVLLQVGFNRRMDPNFRRLKQLVEEGELGAPHVVKITSRDPQPPSEAYIRSSGGMFMDMTIHDFDMARYLAGSEVVEVYARGANLIDPVFGRNGDIDTAVVTLSFQNGVIAVIDNSRQAVYGYDQRVEVFGSLGSACADNCRPTTVELSTAAGITRDKPHHFFLERYSQAYIDEVVSFSAAIQLGETVICGGNDGMQAERIAKAAKESLETGLPVQLPLQTEVEAC
ncbi:inositol 2-dehydrogenase [Paenibacillus albidus]|uniref:Inositol 2-dehydrogenase n=1 Tax=Paenibacillus albidus TaxID=2041023 RepID=A0A917C113_9BACL|nr:inositol 2-dehydrogenase [Paenibacillus albidus]GGF66818.1 inositol 2-dehydrogenase [Paenibacillus albidus]